MSPRSFERRTPGERTARVTLGLLLAGSLLPAQTPAPREDEAGTLAGHAIVLDREGKLLSWALPRNAPYPAVVRLAWERLLTGFPVEENGEPTWLGYCCFDGRTLRGTSWPNNPASFFAGLAQGAAAYYAYSGDRRVIDFMQRALDHQLAQGTTPRDSSWAWPAVPYASGDPGALRYRGAHDFRFADPKDPPKLGRGDGYGVIEPDKLGELGVAYLTVFKITGEGRYRDAALDCARALARRVRPGDVGHSPWPFRVVAETGVVREEYCANLAPTLRLFDELARLGLGETGEWRRARQVAWDWLLAFPVKNDVWSNYFEDVPWLPQTSNLNQYDAGEWVRYVLENPEQDPDWRDHADRALRFIERTFGGDTPREKGAQWGAVTLSEQAEYMYKMGSHTARFASLLALWHERTGDPRAKEKALRSFNWASYMCDERGVVRVGPQEQSFWFSDGYGDYIRHFMAGVAAIPEWAPFAEDHVLGSSSVLTSVAYAPGTVRYSTFDDAGLEVLRLSFVPRTVTADGRPLGATARGPGFTVDEKTGVVRVRRAGARVVTLAR